MHNAAAIFQEDAVCLTKFGPDSGQSACAILARKEWERQSGKGEHANEFWWGIGEEGITESIQHLIAEYEAKSVIFVAVKDQTLKASAPPEVLVWRKYALAGQPDIAIPENVLVTSSVSIQSYSALVCKSCDPIRVTYVARFANCHYKYLKKSGELGSSKRGQRTTSPLVKWTSGAITAADCDSVIEFSAHFAEPNCVELRASKTVPFIQIDALDAIKNKDEWVSAVATIRQ
jgi:hypothetical protein